MKNSANDLRQLYRSARKIAASNDTDELLNNLLEDLLTNTRFERILLLRLNQTDLSLVTEICHGFEEPHHIMENIPFTAATGRLHQVYADREPSNIGLSFAEQNSPISSALILDSEQIIENSPDRRTNIKLYISSADTLCADFSKKMKYQNFSIVLLDNHDVNMTSLLGTVESFLIIPISNQDNFYGFIIADKSYSNETISYDEVRFSYALANHSANSLCRAREHQQMLTKISNQLDEINHLETHYKAIMQNLRSGLIILDQLMNIIEMNQAAEFILGYQEDELINKPIEFLFAGPDDDCLFLDKDDKLDTEMGMLSEISMYRKNGHIFPAEMCVSLVIDKDDDIHGLSCIFRDISTRKALEKDLARTDKLASLGELAGGIAHEIKNPLAGIAGAIQILSRHKKESSHGYIYKEIIHQINRLNSSVDGLLQFAKPGATNFEPIDLKNLIDTVLLTTNSELKDKDISVTTRFTINPPIVKGDANQLQVVLSNIITNAIEAVDSKGTILIQTYWNSNDSSTLHHGRGCNIPECSTDAGLFVVAITDSGIGLDSDSLEKIFNPFYTNKSYGIGLGLSISHRIIEQHGGVILVKSTPGQGATFSIQLPVCA